MHLHSLPLSHPEPRPFLPNCYQEHLGWLSFILLITLWGASLSCSIIPPVCWLRRHCSLLMLRANSADLQQGLSPGLNIQMNFFGMPHSWPTFMDSLLFFMNNWCPVAARILQGRFLPFINSLYSYTFFSPQGHCFTHFHPFFSPPYLK